MDAIDELTVYNDIRQRLRAVTPEQVAAAGRRLLKSKIASTERANIVGVVEQPATRALYTLWLSLESKSAVEMATARSVDEEEIEREHMQLAAVLDMLSDVAEEMFWAQAKLDLGFHEFSNVGLRTGWTLVKTPREQGSALMAVLRGGAGPTLPEDE